MKIREKGSISASGSWPGGGGGGRGGLQIREGVQSPVAQASSLDLMPEWSRHHFFKYFF